MVRPGQRRSYKKCSICGIRREPNLKVFLSRFPLDPERCKLWVKATGIEDLVYLSIEKLHENKYICGSHFAGNCFNEKQSRLLKTAVPTLNLLLPPLSDELFKEFPQHDMSVFEKRAKRAAMAEITNTMTEYPCRNPENLTSQACFDAPTELNAPAAFEFIPVASTSKAPDNMTYKRNCDEPTGRKVLVHSYERIKINKVTRALDQLTKNEKKLMNRLKKANTWKCIAKNRLDLDSLDSEVLKDLIINIVKNNKRKSVGKRWSIKSKLSALSIFKRSPKAYRQLSSMIELPSTRTLQRILKDIPMEPGVHEKVLNILTNKAKSMDKKNENSKFCVLLFDEIALKKRLIYNECLDKVEGYVDFGSGESMGRRNKMAGHALVFMIQGIWKKFKQPIAHYFVEATIDSEKLSVLIKNIINKIHDTGFKVLSTVCDQGPTNIGALNLLKKSNHIPLNENYFFVDNKNTKIYIIFDIPHLFKSIRNNFFQAGIMKYKEKTAKWAHLQEANKRNTNFLNFKKVNSNVINPTYKIKMKVKYAAHALSNTMSAVLKMMAWNHTGSNEIMDTAYIIEEMDKLFDCTNGPASAKDIKKKIRENVSLRSNHLELWNYYLKTIDSIEFLKSDSFLKLKQVRCIKGFQISLKSFKDIWNLLQKSGFRYMNLRQFNQDSLENLFCVIRQHGVTNRNPTCYHFNAALKSSIVSGLTITQSRGNCEEDFNKLFITYNELKTPETVLDEAATIDENTITNNDYPMLSIPDEQDIENILELYNFENQPIVYVSGYLAAKVLAKNECCNCANLLKDTNVDKTLYNYIKFREWWSDKTSLTYPSEALCLVIKKATEVFKIVEPDLHRLDIAQWCTLQLNTHIEMTWFNCVHHSTAVKDFLFSTISKLFIRKKCKDLNENVIKYENKISSMIKLNQQLNKDK